MQLQLIEIPVSPIEDRTETETKRRHGYGYGS